LGELEALNMKEHAHFYLDRAVKTMSDSGLWKIWIMKQRL